MTQTTARLRRVFSTAATALLLTGVVVPSIGSAAPAEDGPTVTVDVTEGLDPRGENITVAGEGFDPEGNTGARPPLMGQPGGVYVAVARVNDPWQPSAGASSSDGQTIEQRWALPEPSHNQLSLMGDVTLMEDDGSFEVELEARADADLEAQMPDGDYAVIVFPGSGATNPDEEVMVPLSFAGEDDDPNGDDSQDDNGQGDDGEDEGEDEGEDDDQGDDNGHDNGDVDGDDDQGDDNGDDGHGDAHVPSSATLAVDTTENLNPVGHHVTITGTGFDPEGNLGTRPPLMGQPGGVYVAFARVDENWEPSAGASADTRVIINDEWALPQPSYRTLSDMDGIILMEEDGSFETTLTVATDDDAATQLPDGQYAIVAYPGSGATNPDEEVLVPLQFDAPDEDDGNGTNDHNDRPGSKNGNHDDKSDTGSDDEGEVVTGTITDGILDWGVRDSFRSYILGSIANGSVTVTEGAAENPDGTFRFVEPTGQLDDDTLSAGFAGTVQFAGHEFDGEALLDLTISSPTVDIDGDAGQLRVDVRSRGLEDPGNVFEAEQVHFADLDLGDTLLATNNAGDVKVTRFTADQVDNGLVTIDDIEVTLTEDGSEAFADFYDAGERLDPISLTIAVDDAQFDAPEPPASAGGGSQETDNTASVDNETSGGFGAGFDDLAGPDAATEGSLPRTGASATLLLALGLMALVLGATAVAVSRRRTER